MDNTFVSYIIALVVIVLAIFIIKKVASCLFKTITFVIAAAIVAYIVYSLYQ